MFWLKSHQPSNYYSTSVLRFNTNIFLLLTHVRACICIYFINNNKGNSDPGRTFSFMCLRHANSKWFRVFFLFQYIYHPVLKTKWWKKMNISIGRGRKAQFKTIELFNLSYPPIYIYDIYRILLFIILYVVFFTA